MDKKEKKAGEKPRVNSERKFYLFTAIGCAAVLVAIIVTAIALSGTGSVDAPTIDIDQPTVELPDDDPDADEPVVVVPDGMVLPVDGGETSNDYGFYHNTTLDSYYEHSGVDFTVAVGTEVRAVESGRVESIYKDDILLGTQVVIDHGDGLKSLYRFVTEKEGLKVGDTVEKGEVIATVAEAGGNEYKEGAHLHFEILENGAPVDPTKHLTLEEK